MAMTIQQISPVAHLPLVLGVVRKLKVAARIDTFCPPHPANVLSCGRGVEALLLAILDGHHALYKVGARLAERGMLPCYQADAGRAELHHSPAWEGVCGLVDDKPNPACGAVFPDALDVCAHSTHS